MELSPHHIRVNSISPGATETLGLAPRFGSPAVDLMLKQQLIQRLGQVDEVIAGAVYLVSNEDPSSPAPTCSSTAERSPAAAPGTAFAEEASKARFAIASTRDAAPSGSLPHRMAVMRWSWSPRLASPV